MSALGDDGPAPALSASGRSAKCRRRCAGTRRSSGGSTCSSRRGTRPRRQFRPSCRRLPDPRSTRVRASPRSRRDPRASRASRQRREHALTTASTGTMSRTPSLSPTNPRISPLPYARIRGSAMRTPSIHPGNGSLSAPSTMLGRTITKGTSPRSADRICSPMAFVNTYVSCHPFALARAEPSLDMHEDAFLPDSARSRPSPPRRTPGPPPRTGPRPSPFPSPSPRRFCFSFPRRRPTADAVAGAERALRGAPDAQPVDERRGDVTHHLQVFAPLR